MLTHNEKKELKENGFVSSRKHMQATAKRNLITRNFIIYLLKNNISLAEMERRTDIQKSDLSSIRSGMALASEKSFLILRFEFNDYFENFLLENR